MLRKMSKQVGGVCVLIALLGMPVSAGMSKGLNLSTSYNNNILRDSDSQGDYITQLKGSVGWGFRSARSYTQFYYSGTGYMFAEVGSRSFALNGFGASYVRQLAHGKRLDVGSFASVRLDRSGYEVYDNAEWKNYVAFRMYLPARVMLHTGYTVQLRNYWRMDARNYSDHSAFAQASKLFSTQTLVRGEVGYGFKHHADSEGQLVLGLEISQPLAQNTSLNMRYERRLNTHANVFGENLLDQDIDMLNNRYDYNGQVWSAKLTQQLSNSRKLVIAGGFDVRSYQTLTTLAWRGEPLFADELRKDKNPYLSVAFETPLRNRVQARFVYDFESNKSNDNFFNFNKRNSLSVDLGLTF
ncbi:MAG: hypothetical protein HOE48_25000 [Candidatus Latescibacteria bacterium]|nr:hypothetical protein [Candidatus Latescibacterota bacterium]MBT4141191.1 hypothetical protein [Candidatus Latescibacterota bacterium]MBT5831199.1 hypothetical protein [Candidatus Latescibacterota bacterium]